MMSELNVVIKNRQGEEKYRTQDQDQLVMVYKGSYEPGDTITFDVTDVNCYYIIRVDDTMDEAYVYLTRSPIVYTIPFAEKKVPYNPRAFTGDSHYITVRRAYAYENSSYRNLAKNVMDQHGDLGCYPHACANVETRGESVFAARNAIDGVTANGSHGEWPYQSWGINRQDDAELILDFGRPVDFDKIILCTRADFPHDNWWVKATLTCSDGTSQVLEMEKCVKPHMFPMIKKGITWVKLSHLIKADDPSPFPALSQIEVYGTNTAVSEN